METIEVAVLLVLLVLVAATVKLTFELRNMIQSLRVQSHTALTAAVRLETTVDRMESATKIVAEDLVATAEALEIAATQRTTQGETLDRMEDAAHIVADNLQASVDRADATDETIPGKSADAALRTGDTAKAIRARQDAAKDKSKK